MSLVILPKEPTERDFENWQKRIAHARRNFPDLVPEVPTTTREARRLAKELGVMPAPGEFYRDIPFAMLGAEDYEELFDVFALKLTLAHFYRCFGRPLARTGAVYATAITNAHLGRGEWLAEILSQLPNLEVPRHGSEDLGDQILTRWHSSRDGALGLFITNIQDQLFVMGMAGETDQWREHLKTKGKLSGPFQRHKKD